jgi:WD40 repeat protein
MYNKSIFLLATFFLSIALIGMETNKELFTISLDGQQIYVTDIKNNKTVPFNHNCWVTIAAISKSGKFISTGSGTSQARLFDRKKEQQIHTFNLGSSVTAFDFAPCENHLAIASNANKVHIFNLTTYDEIKTVDHNSRIFSINFISSGNQLSTKFSNDTMHIFKEETQ